MAPFDEGRVEKPEEPEPGKGYPGSELLGRSTPEAVYEGLLDRDPLHIRERCMKSLDERAQLLPIDRLVTMSMAAVAHTAAAYGGEPGLDAWLRERIDATIEALHVQEREFERMGLPQMEPFDAHCVFLAESLGIDPAMTRRGCIVFNRLPREQRAAFWGLVVKRRSIREHLAQDHRSKEEVMASLRKALEALSRLDDPDHDWEMGVGDA